MSVDSDEVQAIANQNDLSDLERLHQSIGSMQAQVSTACGLINALGAPLTISQDKSLQALPVPLAPMLISLPNVPAQREVIAQSAMQIGAKRTLKDKKKMRKQKVADQIQISQEKAMAPDVEPVCDSVMLSSGAVGCEPPELESVRDKPAGAHPDELSRVCFGISLDRSQLGNHMLKVLTRFAAFTYPCLSDGQRSEVATLTCVLADLAETEGAKPNKNSAMIIQLWSVAAQLMNFLLEVDGVDVSPELLLGAITQVDLIGNELKILANSQC